MLWPLLYQAHAEDVEVGRDAKGLYFRTTDNPFELRFNMHIQPRLRIRHQKNDPNQGEFSVKRLRPQFSGYVLKKGIRYNLVLETAGGSASMRDGWVEYRGKSAAFRMGQWKQPFDREELTSDQRLLFVDRSIVNSAFSYRRGRMANLSINSARAVWDIAVSNGPKSLNRSNDDGHFAFLTRLNVAVTGEQGYAQGALGSPESPLWQIGTALAWESTHPGGDVNFLIDQENRGRIPNYAAANNAFRMLSYTIDTNFRYRWYSLDSAYFLRGIEDRKIGDANGNVGTLVDQGFIVDMGFMLQPDTWALALRYGHIAYEGIPNELVHGIALIHFMDGHNIKITTDFRNIRTAHRDNFEGRLQLQVKI